MPHKIIAKQYTTKSMPARKRSLSYEWVAKWRILLIDMAIKLKEKKIPSRKVTDQFPWRHLKQMIKKSDVLGHI